MNQKYNADYHDDWAWSLAIKGADDKEISDAMHISRQTLNNWKYKKNKDGSKELTSFGLALQAGKDAADAKVERKLYERATGYEYEEVKQIIKHDTQGKPQIEKSEVTKKKVPPDTMAIMYWLNNRKRMTGEWSQRQEVTLNADESLAGVTIYLPDNGRDKDEGKE